MGFGNSRCENFKLYESIKASLSRVNESDNSFTRYLISANSIPIFTELIKKNNIFENPENEKDLEKDLNSKLKKYTLEKDIIIYSKFEQCKIFIEDIDKKYEKENEFIIVDEKFLETMKINDVKDNKVKIIIDKNKDMKIKFPDFEQEISFQIKNNNIGFFEFAIKKYPDNNENDDKENEAKNNNINIQLLCLANIPNLKNYFLENQEKFSKTQKNNNKFSKAFSDIIYNIGAKEDINIINSTINLKNIIKEDSNLSLPKFIPFLFEKIHNELNERNKDDNNYNDFIESDETCAETEYYNFLEKYDKNNKSIISETFCFEELFKKKCKHCDFETFNFEMINKLVFNVNEILCKNKRENINLFDCFNLYTQINSNNCKICKNEIEELKIFNSLPNILSIFLDLENNNNVKFDINFEIDLKKYLFNWNNYRNLEAKYQLIGMTNFNKENSEYYLGYCKVDNKWYFYNNSSYSVINDIKEIKGIPVILFYQKLNN